MALLEQLKTFGAIRFSTGGKDFTGSSTNIDLPRGDYIAIKQAEGTACILGLQDGYIYTFSGFELFDDGVYYFSVSCPLLSLQRFTSDIFHSLGDIDKALDELHTYAQTFITGGADE